MTKVQSALLFNSKYLEVARGGKVAKVLAGRGPGLRAPGARQTPHMSPAPTPTAGAAANTFSPFPAPAYTRPSTPNGVNTSPVAGIDPAPVSTRPRSDTGAGGSGRTPAERRADNVSGTSTPRSIVPEITALPPASLQPTLETELSLRHQ